MDARMNCRPVTRAAWARALAGVVVWFGLSFVGMAQIAAAQTNTATPAAPSAPATTPKTGDAKATPAPVAPSPVPVTPTPAPPAAQPSGPVPKAPGPDQPADGEGGAPGLLDNSALENVDVAARPIIMIKGASSYDDAFKSIKASLDQVKAAMAKAGLKPSGHPITIFSEPDDKGFKYEAGIPVAAKPEKTDLGDGIIVGLSPSGKAIKFQHRNDYDSIDSTYDAIAAYLDAKGILASNPYVEEYLTDLTTADDPNLQVDIYVFIK